MLADLSRNPQLADETIDTYDQLLRLLNPEPVSLPTREEIRRHRHLIRHEADVPVLVSALKAVPDWVLTTNKRHFTKQVALRTQLKIVTPQEFLKSIKVVG